MSRHQKRDLLGLLVIVIGAVCFAFVTSCSSSDRKSSTENAGAGTDWPARMRSLATSLDQLFPYVASQEEFSDAKNKEKIDQLIQNFSSSVGAVPKHVGEDILGKDPLVKFALQRLQSNTQHARLAFNEGHKEFSRNLLKENMGLCFSCHTTSQFGPEFKFSTKQLNPNFRISSSEKAYYYVATRQFNQAAEVLESSIKKPIQSNAELHEQLAALQQYLSLQVRVEKNPKNAIRAVEEFIRINQLPYFISVDVKAWLKSLKEWQMELASGKKPTGSPVAQAKKLISFANRTRQDEGYQSGYVDYLRATAVLHEGLRSTTSLLAKSEIYRLLGNCYETLASSGTWELPEVYFEACVRATPKTPIAEKCYVEYERVTVMGFSGSAGVFLPKAERERLDELKVLSGIH